MYQNHIVLIGLNRNTHGTGFIVSKRNQCFVITCRHVIYEATQSKGSLFALPNPKKTKSPEGGYSVLKLDTPRYHPDDDNNGTYDIAVAEIIDVNPSFLNSHNINPINLETDQFQSNYGDGTQLFATGYPIEYAEKMLAENVDEPLPPRDIKGIIRSIPLQNIPQHGFNAPLKEAYFAQTDFSNKSGKGMSGGVVYYYGTKTIAGLVLASGNFDIIKNGEVEEKFFGFVFAGFNRILETISA